MTLYRRSPLDRRCRQLTPHLDGDVAAFISSDGKIVVAGTGDRPRGGSSGPDPNLRSCSTTDRPADERHEVTAIAREKARSSPSGMDRAPTIWRREGDTHDWVLSDTIALPARTMDLAIDDGAPRLATASYDGTVALWNFEGMNPGGPNDARGDPASAIALDAWAPPRWSPRWRGPVLGLD
ncbi:MAG: hypothetical protein R2710_30345 [Acidimicrobiales bacterium]